MIIPFFEEIYGYNITENHKPPILDDHFLFFLPFPKVCVSAIITDPSLIFFLIKVFPY
jgi:hypothetical protein